MNEIDLKNARLVGEYSAYLSMMIRDYDDFIKADNAVYKSGAQKSMEAVLKVAKENLEKNGHLCQ
jgi:NAD(P)H-flavin reductase